MIRKEYSQIEDEAKKEAKQRVDTFINSKIDDLDGDDRQKTISALDDTLFEAMVCKYGHDILIDELIYRSGLNFAKLLEKNHDQKNITKT